MAINRSSIFLRQNHPRSNYLHFFWTHFVITPLTPLWSKVFVMFWATAILFATFEIVLEIHISSQLLEALLQWVIFILVTIFFVPSGCGMIASNPSSFFVLGAILFILPVGYPAYLFVDGILNFLDDDDDEESGGDSEGSRALFSFRLIGLILVGITLLCYFINFVLSLMKAESETARELRLHWEWVSNQISTLTLGWISQQEMEEFEEENEMQEGNEMQEEMEMEEIKDGDDDDDETEFSKNYILCDSCDRTFSSPIPFLIHLSEDHKIPDGALYNKPLSSFTPSKENENETADDNVVGMFGALISLLYPRPRIHKKLKKSPISFPYVLHVATMFGFLFLFLSSYEMYKGAVDLRDNFEEKSDEVKEAIDDLRESGYESVADSLEDIREFFEDLALGIYLAMIVGGSVGLVLTLQHFPLLYLGWRKEVLEVRYQIKQRATFLEVGIWNKCLLVGNFVSSILLLLFVGFFVVGVICFFLAFEPLRDWLLSLWEFYVTILISTVIVMGIRLGYDWYFLEKGKTPRHIGGIGFLDIPFLAGAVPYSALASLMRLLYVLGYALFALPRFDITLLPEGFRTFDTAWTSFHSLLTYERLIAEPLVTIAAECFLRGREDHLDESISRKRIRNRWWLYSVMALHPNLRQYRKG